MLVEVMMSALLVALAATAVFKGIDGATATSAQSKARAVAGNLAHEDQERMRAMDPRKLASYAPGPAPKVVNGVTYTVDSDAEWVSDRGESESCTRGDGRVVYVRIASTVTWPDMRGSKPVAASSLVAINNAYAKGSLAVKVVDRTGSNGVPGVPVSLDAPVGASKSTNDAGCVVFDGLDTGTYFGQFSKSGYVDMGGNNVVRPANGFSVTTGSTGVSTFIYDQDVTADFKFVTTVNGTQYDTSSPGLLLKNAQMPPNGERRQIFPGGNQSTWSYTNLFPFASGYTAFAVACANDAPTGGTTLTSPVGGVAVMTRVGDPGHNQSPVKVFLPSINVTAQRNAAASNSMRIYVRPQAGACGRSQNWTSLTNASPYVGQPPLNNSRGFTPGLYTVCVDDRPAAGSDGATRRVTQDIDISDGQDETLTLNVRTTTPRSPQATCP